MEIKTVGDRIELHAPYHPELPARAKAIGGRWNGKFWHFDTRVEEQVKQLAADIYGTGETVTVRVELPFYIDEKEYWAYGRRLLSRRSRDTSVWLGTGVVLVEGEFERRGGSMQYPQIGNCDGVMLDVFDVPAGLVNDNYIEDKE